MNLSSLWIAFKLFNFDLLKQQSKPTKWYGFRCELLSNYLILTYWNSLPSLWAKEKLLWIAFKLFNFDLLKQLPGWWPTGRASCELLSNYLILTYWNSTRDRIRQGTLLWIAFKLFNFDLLKQLRCLSHHTPCRCELLSNYLILTYWNSCLERRLG